VLVLVRDQPAVEALLGHAGPEQGQVAGGEGRIGGFVEGLAHGGLIAVAEGVGKGRQGAVLPPRPGEGEGTTVGRLRTSGGEGAGQPGSPGCGCVYRFDETSCPAWSLDARPAGWRPFSGLTGVPDRP